MIQFRICALFLAFSFTGCSGIGVLPTPEKLNLAASQTKPYVVLVSLDGYRADYTELYSPPFLSEMKKEGTSAKSLIPVYPSKTFTNHLSIVTGLYAENHGIVANYFYDPVRKQDYGLSNRAAVQDPSWYSGEPIWATAEKQGMLAATYFWPGSEARISGVKPTYTFPFNKTTPPEVQTQQVITWLNLPEEKRPHLIALYFHHVDSAGHQFGPNSPQVKEAVLKVDEALKGLSSQLKTLAIPVNLIVVSDHGMQALDPKKVIYLEDYVQMDGLKLVGDEPQMLIYEEDIQKREKIYQKFKAKEDHFHIYKRSELPTEFHYSKNPRAGDLIITAEPPYALTKTRASLHLNSGAHGFDPKYSNMHAIFYASGPQIKKHFQLASFRNIHIYPFLAKLLQLQVTETIDGDLNVLSPALK